MAEITGIEWCDHTFNPWIGCTKISPACAGCYAAAMMDDRYGRVRWGAGEDRVRTAPANWKQPLSWNRKAIAAGTRPMVFCASLADVFDNEVDPLWRRDLFELIAATPNLIWLLLTKRIGNVEKMTDPMAGNLLLPSNAAVGATMANQEEWDRDAWKLRRVREVRAPLFTFTSIEPMLGWINMGEDFPDWVIAGGESGREARPSHPDWFRSLRDQCAAAGVPFLFKQWGEWVGAAHGDHEYGTTSAATGEKRFWPVSETAKQHHWGAPTSVHAMSFHVGKKAAGRLLDGVTHDGFPS